MYCFSFFYINPTFLSAMCQLSCPSYFLHPQSPTFVVSRKVTSISTMVFRIAIRTSWAATRALQGGTFITTGSWSGVSSLAGVPAVMGTVLHTATRGCRHSATHFGYWLLIWVKRWSVYYLWVLLYLGKQVESVYLCGWWTVPGRSEVWGSFIPLTRSKCEDWKLLVWDS
jgi:hypothetical protein